MFLFVNLCCTMCIMRNFSLSSGRWESTGKELFKLSDRYDHQFCLGPVSISFICPNHHLKKVIFFKRKVLCKLVMTKIFDWKSAVFWNVQFKTVLSMSVTRLYCPCLSQDCIVHVYFKTIVTMKPGHKKNPTWIIQCVEMLIFFSINDLMCGKTTFGDVIDLALSGTTAFWGY